jgi:hypothetical protein
MDSIFQTESAYLLKLGKYVSISMAILTIITFIAAMFAIPISGANAPVNNEFIYPYLNTLQQFPRDFIWQYIAIIQVTCFVLFITILKMNIKPEKQIFANISSQFGLLSAGILLVNYYCQVMVVPSSLAANNTEGIGLIIQYNPYGLFIAMEELGYILMCMSLFSLTPIFKNKKGRSLYLTLIVSITLIIISFVVIISIFGLNKLDRFEVVIISIAWFTLIVFGFMVYKIFSEEKKCLTTAST